ncbi:hypothetical protein [Nocardioides sp. AE5]|uniref:hypothetical protein n=1 Tax=Nocardioides sp. AE5 TaxID=2962573 RepID=UPI0028821521|nr:hypothetical protein [Nocardioides sp. AE5]MDT0200472.1 hypothetical protein [Nocardioides sp. AE5]
MSRSSVRSRCLAAATVFCLTFSLTACNDDDPVTPTGGGSDGPVEPAEPADDPAEPGVEGPASDEPSAKGWTPGMAIEVQVWGSWEPATFLGIEGELYRVQLADGTASLEADIHVRDLDGNPPPTPLGGTGATGGGDLADGEWICWSSGVAGGTQAGAMPDGNFTYAGSLFISGDSFGSGGTITVDADGTAHLSGGGYDSLTWAQVVIEGDGETALYLGFPEDTQRCTHE